MAADNVLEYKMVTPQGLLITANECQHTDLFWAMRGGGGGTFGVIITATFKTIPTMAVAVLKYNIVTATAGEDFWDIVTYMVSQYPYLADQGIMGYPFVIPDYTIALDVHGALANGDFCDHSSLYGASNISEILAPIWKHITSTWGTSILSFTNTTTYYRTRYARYQAFHDTSPTGTEIAIGSRLLSASSLTGDQTALKSAIKVFVSDVGAALYLLGGSGIWDAVPRGGGDAVNPVWRKTLGHFVTAATWIPRNEMDKRIALVDSHNRTQFLRDLEPDSGVYVNEASVDEPDQRIAFWGPNYPRLLAIKKLTDPTNVLWCSACVGNEGWEVVWDGLCEV